MAIILITRDLRFAIVCWIIKISQGVLHLGCVIPRTIRT